MKIRYAQRSPPLITRSNTQKPELVTVETQIIHSTKKAESASSLADKVAKDEERQSASLQILVDGADEIERRRREAAGV